MDKEYLSFIFETIIFIVIGIIIGAFTFGKQISCSNANLIDGSLIIEKGEWNVIYIEGNQTYFNTKGDIEGRIVYPKYIVLNLQGKKTIDIIETFTHEMAHLYFFLDKEHFILKDNSSNWDEYSDEIGNNNPPKITKVVVKRTINK